MKLLLAKYQRLEQVERQDETCSKKSSFIETAKLQKDPHESLGT